MRIWGSVMRWERCLGSVMAERGERERQRSSGGEREKMGEKNKVGPATAGTHKKIESRFESDLD